MSRCTGNPAHPDVLDRSRDDNRLILWFRRGKMDLHEVYEAALRATLAEAEAHDARRDEATDAGDGEEH